jgi:hypothetical protein
MAVIIALIALGILLEVLFFAVMWPPWRSQFPSMSWMLVMLSGVLFLYDSAILLATLQIPVPPIPALLLLLGKDVLLAWRFKIALKARQAFHPPRRRRSAMNPLFDIIPARARAYVYAAVALLMIAWGAWQAADGDWKVAVGALVTTLTAALAHANTAEHPSESGSEQPPLPPPGS